MELTVAYGKQAEAISLPTDAATCAGLAAALAARFGVAPGTIKLLAPGGRAPLRLADRGDEALADAGGCKLRPPRGRLIYAAACLPPCALSCPSLSQRPPPPCHAQACCRAPGSR